jgi:iron-sulfur cluster assembly protein
MKITDAARLKMIDVLRGETTPLLRFGLQGGGCAGMNYYFAVETTKEEDDLEYVLQDEYKLIVDAASSMYLEEAEIDYKKDLMGESFVFNNPTVKSSCGCGQSVLF